MTMTPEASQYAAFISYSHAADGRLAPQLQLALQRFAKPWYRTRAIRIFRDKTSLSATPSLWPSIEAALRNSAFLVIMASPDAKKSQWVTKEVEAFLDRAGSERILIVLTDGELVWNEAAADFDWDRTSAFPRLGRRVFEQEPLWVDLRSVRGSQHLSQRNPDFRDSVARLSSAIRGIPTDQLIGEDIRHHSRTMRLVWSTVALLVLLAAGLAVAGYSAYRRGIEALAAAKRTIAEFTVSSAVGLESDEPLEAALVLSELDDSYRSDRALALLRRVANELPVAVLKGIDPKFSGDGRHVLTFPTDGTAVLLWSVDTLDKPIILRPHSGSVVDAAIDGTGRRIAIASTDKTVTVWDITGPRELTVIDGYAPTYMVMNRDSIALSADGTRVAFLNGKDAEIASTAGDGKVVELTGHRDAVLSIAYSHDGHFVASTSLDRTTRIWSPDGSVKNVLRIDRSHPVSAQFSSDDSHVLTSDDNGTVRLWSVGEVGSPTVFSALEYTPSFATISSDNRSVVAGTKEGAILMWAVNSPQHPSVVHGSAWVRTASFMPEANAIVTGSDDGKARVWINYEHPVVFSVHHGLVTSAVFEPAHGRIFTSGVGETTQVWSVNGEDAEPVLLKGNAAFTSVDFSPEGKRLIAGSGNGDVNVWSTTGEGQPLILRGHSASISAATFSRDGTHILTVSADGTARIWNADGHGESVVLQDEGRRIGSAAFSHDGTRVVTVADIVRVWSIDGHPGAVVFQDPKHPPREAEFSPDGSRVLVVAKESRAAFLCSSDAPGPPARLASSDDDVLGVVGARFSPDGKQVVVRAGNTATIWRIDRGGEPIDRRINSRVSDAFFSPNGEKVLVMGAAFGAYVFRANGQGSPLFLAEPDGGWFWRAAFSSDGTYVAASTSLHTVMVWKSDGPSTPLVLAGHTGMIKGFAIDPVKPMIATASEDRSVRVWSFEWQDLMNFVRTRASRSGVCLSADQRIQYLGEETGQAQLHYKACESRFN
jgi:WD40 repeat protein